jgi:tetratricopeptide (TPR) repeat protein
MGLWEDVVRANEQAMRVVNANRSARGRSPALCGHYNSWLDYAYLEVGRNEDARTLLHGCQAQARPHGERSAATDPDEFALFSAVAMWSRFLIDTEEWDGPEAEWAPDLGPSPGPRATWHFTHGLAAARRGDLATAERDLQAFRQAAHDARPAEGSPEAADAETLEYHKRLRVLELELQGMLAAARGQDSVSLGLLRRATLVEDRMAYAFGPPTVDKPSYELLGEELLRQGQRDAAAAAFARALRSTPNRSLARRGLARAVQRAEAAP